MNKSEQVYKFIKENISNGTYLPGSRINITDIVERLNVSRTPVREALKQLAAENLVTLIKNSGAEVRAFDLDELEEIVMIRQELEILAVGLAAANCSDETIRLLNQYIEKMEEFRASGDARNYSLTNRDFHMTIYRASGSKVLYGLIEDLWTRSERTMLIFELFPLRLQQSNNEHRQIVDALEAHDAERARTVLSHQKEEGFVNVIRLLKTAQKYIKY